MKLLIVDARPEEKYAEILKECRMRKIEVQIETASIPARYALNKDKDKEIDGIIMDLELPLFAGESDMIEPGEGERLLRYIHKKEFKIPILIFSQETTKVQYPYVICKIRNWQNEKSKFFEFIKEVHIFKLQKGRLQ